MMTTIGERRLRWFGHVANMKEQGMPKLKWNPKV